MDTLVTLRRRINAAEQTKKITAAMELAAAARARKNDGRRAGATAWKKELTALAEELQLCGLIPDKYRQGGAKPCYVAIGGERGLAGGYNAAALQLAGKEIPPGAPLLAVGTKLAEGLRSRGYETLSGPWEVFDLPRLGTAEQITGKILSLLSEGKADGVELVAGGTRRHILPLAAPKRKKERDFLCDSDPGKMFDTLLPQWLCALLYDALVHSYGEEQKARIIAMGDATRNADDMIANLGLQFTLLRQSQITGEIIEITGAAEALKGGR